jgi:hypothetical protein
MHHFLSPLSMCRLLLPLSLALGLILLLGCLLDVVTAFIGLLTITLLLLSQPLLFLSPPLILHPEWQHAMAEEIAALEWIDM